MTAFARVGGWVMALLLLAWSASARALPLEDLSRQTTGRVAHLSVRDSQGEEIASGTGFLISRDGRVVTNFHVIDGAERIVAVFPNKREVEVTGVWAWDKAVDIAILQIEGKAFDPLPIATEPAHEGEEIFVIGSPLGLSNSVSAGIVSAVREKGLEGARGSEGEENWSLQITAAVAPGSSGSPILRGNGEVVGIAVGYLTGLQGMPFGILAGKLRTLLASAPAHPRALAAATGVRSVRTNLLISAAVFAGVAGLWLLVQRLHRRGDGARSPLKFP